MWAHSPFYLIASSPHLFVSAKRTALHASTVAFVESCSPHTVNVSSAYKGIMYKQVRTCKSLLVYWGRSSPWTQEIHDAT